MEYQKITKTVEIKTAGGETVTGDSTNILELEQHKTIHADKLVPFHAVETAIVNVSTESASRSDPYGCAGGADLCCTNVHTNESAEFIMYEPILDAVVYSVEISGMSQFPPAFAVTIDGNRYYMTLEEQPTYHARYTCDKHIVLRVENDRHFTISVIADTGLVSVGTHSVVIESCENCA